MQDGLQLLEVRQGVQPLVAVPVMLPEPNIQLLDFREYIPGKLNMQAVQRFRVAFLL